MNIANVDVDVKKTTTEGGASKIIFEVFGRPTYKLEIGCEGAAWLFIKGTLGWDALEDEHLTRRLLDYSKWN